MPAFDAKSSADRRQVRVVTGSRLHFGLLDTVEPFGGAGAMVDDPVTEVVVSPSDRFACPAGGTRVGDIAERVARHAGLQQLPACRVDVTRRAAQHCGLGSGTQLSMAISEAICNYLGLSINEETLATAIAGRGKRSAVGVHGYFRGGFLFEQPRTASDPNPDLNPLNQRVALPESWCVVVVRPKNQVDAVSGTREQQQFACLSGARAETTEHLREMIVDKMLPAADRGDFAAFADAVHRYNRASGELFASVQGGCYNGASVSRVIDWLVDRGVRGVGQSSWGPGIFAWFETTDEARSRVQELPDEIELVTITRPRNRPRDLRG